MKKIKNIVFLFLGVLSVLTISSCDKEKDPEYPVIDMTDDEIEMELSSIIVDTSNAKTRFYLGEEFSSEGLKVKAIYTKDLGNEEIEQKEVEVTQFSVDTEYVNMSKTGQYFVTIIYRDGIQKVSTFYTITVGNSFFPESGVKYLAGIEADVKEIEINQGEKFELPPVSISAKYMVGTEIVEEKNVPSKALTIDTSSVDTNRKGTYMIKYTLKSNVTIEGKVYEIEESTFILVKVLNSVKGITFVSGTTTQAATVKGLDCSDWKFSVDLEIGDNQEITYNSDSFEITGFSTLVAGKYVANVAYYEDGEEVSTTVDIEITEAVGEKIVQCRDFGESRGIDSRTRFGDGFYFYGGPRTTVETKNGSTEGIDFTARFKLNGAGTSTDRFFEVYMPNKGILVLYYETSSVGTERIMNMMDQTGSIIHSFATATTIAKEVIEIEEAGTYYFASQSGGMNIWGCILSYETEGAIEPTPSAIANLEFVSGTTKFIQNGSKDGVNDWVVKASYDDNTSEMLDNSSSKISISELDNSSVGNKQLTVTFDDGHTNKSITVDVVVTDVTLTKLEYVSGTKTQRSTFGYFDTSDFIFKATYSDSSTKELTDKDLSIEVDALTLGNKQMNVTYVDEALQSASTTVEVTTIQMSASNKVLNPSDISSTDVPNVTSGTQQLTVQGFTMPFSDSTITGGKSNTLIEDNKKTVNGIQFNKRLSLKTKGNDLHNVIKFSVEANAKLVVYASSSQDVGKYLFISQDPAAGTVYNDYKVLATKTNQVFEFELATAGDYYILADNAAYIFLIAVEYDQTASTDTSTQTAIQVFSPMLVANTITIEKTETTSDIFKDMIFAITYSNGGLGFVTSSEVTISTTVDTTKLGQTEVTVTYNGLTTNFVVDVVEPTE